MNPLKHFGIIRKDLKSYNKRGTSFRYDDIDNEDRHCAICNKKGTSEVHGNHLCSYKCEKEYYGSNNPTEQEHQAEYYAEGGKYPFSKYRKKT